VTCFVSHYIPFQFKEVIELIDQTSANSVCKCLPRAAKAGTNYATITDILYPLIKTSF
jgi:hypothetical protein